MNHASQNHPQDPQPANSRPPIAATSDTGTLNAKPAPTGAPQIHTLLRQQAETGALSPLAAHMAVWLTQRAGVDDPLATVAVAWLLERTREGHVALTPAGRTPPFLDATLATAVGVAPNALGAAIHAALPCWTTLVEDRRPNAARSPSTVSRVGIDPAGGSDSGAESRPTGAGAVQTDHATDGAEERAGAGPRSDHPAAARTEEAFVDAFRASSRAGSRANSQADPANDAHIAAAARGICADSLSPSPSLSQSPWRNAAQHAESAPAAFADRPVRPLVWDGQRLYLRRHDQAERAIAQAFLERGMATRADPARDAAHAERVRQFLDALFGSSCRQPVVEGRPLASPHPDAGPDGQRAACAVAAGRGATIITGGPGTGKTTTVGKLLLLLLALNETTAHATIPSPSARVETAAARPLRIALAAPTGKAAARLVESVRGFVERAQRELDASWHPRLQRLPVQATTVHRLLRVGRDDGLPRHHRLQPLPLDVLVVDEASMLDLERLADVLRAVPREARVILLGDRDQLASVEPGAAFSALCTAPALLARDRRLDDWLRATCGVTAAQAATGAIAELHFSHRFASDSTLGMLATAMRRGDVETADRLLNATRTPDGRVDSRPENDHESDHRGVLSWVSPTPDTATRACPESAAPMSPDPNGTPGPTAPARSATKNASRPGSRVQRFLPVTREAHAPTTTWQASYRMSNKNPHADACRLDLDSLLGARLPSASDSQESDTTGYAAWWAETCARRPGSVLTRASIPARPPMAMPATSRTATEPGSDDRQNDHRPDLDAWAQDCLQRLGRFQVLAAVRRGPYGVETLNRRIVATLFTQHDAASTAWFAGRVVMVTRNNRELGLANGDIGVVLPFGPVSSDTTVQPLRVAFAHTGADGRQAVRWVAPGLLTEVEDAFAITVHKSQGSEYDAVVLVLPAEDDGFLGREMVYTATTRARRDFTVLDPSQIASESTPGSLPDGPTTACASVFDRALARTTARDGGLHERLAELHAGDVS